MIATEMGTAPPATPNEAEGGSAADSSRHARWNNDVDAVDIPRALIGWPPGSVYKPRTPVLLADLRYEERDAVWRSLQPRGYKRRSQKTPDPLDVILSRVQKDGVRA